MQRFLSGQDVTLVIETELDPQTVSGLEYALLNENESQIAGWTQLVVADAMPDTSVTIVISGIENTLSVSEPYALRIVQLRVTTQTGTLQFSDSYIVESDESLIAGLNSFLGYHKALFVAEQIPNLPGWANASKQARIAAMIQAKQNLARLKYRYQHYPIEYGEPIFAATSFLTSGFVIGDLNRLEAGMYEMLPPDLKTALGRAQVIEANFLLGGDPDEEQRRSNMISSKVGEASQFFRAVKPLELPICKKAMYEVGRFVEYSVHSGRGGQ